MRLVEYLDAIGESAPQFAVRSGVRYRTLRNVLSGDGCHAATALRIIKATRELPTPNGGTVTLEDLTQPSGRWRRDQMVP